LRSLATRRSRKKESTITSTNLIDDDPTIKYEETTIKPEEPTIKPEEPAIKPEEPTIKPEEPTIQPEEPAIKPEEPAIKPEEPTIQPEEPAIQPEEPAIQPEAEEPTIQPEEPQSHVISLQEEPTIKPKEPQSHVVSLQEEPSLRSLATRRSRNKESTIASTNLIDDAQTTAKSDKRAKIDFWGEEAPKGTYNHVLGGANAANIQDDDTPSSNQSPRQKLRPVKQTVDDNMEHKALLKRRTDLQMQIESALEANKYTRCELHYHNKCVLKIQKKSIPDAKTTA
jgi:hypothetical protein